MNSLKLILVLCSLMLTMGCQEASTPVVGESTNEIQAYLDANPDAIEKPEDVAADENAEFDAGNAGSE
ncbi:MAG: hypothetical protein AAGJ40_23750 [Planctomycetota bacterium]